VHPAVKLAKYLAQGSKAMHKRTLGFCAVLPFQLIAFGPSQVVFYGYAQPFAFCCEILAAHRRKQHYNGYKQT
jgi:hypothetical protein